VWISRRDYDEAKRKSFEEGRGLGRLEAEQKLKELEAEQRLKEFELMAEFLLFPPPVLFMIAQDLPEEMAQEMLEKCKDCQKVDGCEIKLALELALESKS